MLSFILLIAFTVVWYALLVFIAWAAGGIVAADHRGAAHPHCPDLLCGDGRAAELGDRLQMKFKKGH